jgi:hypothetical protein
MAMDFSGSNSQKDLKTVVHLREWMDWRMRKKLGTAKTLEAETMIGMVHRVKLVKLNKG